MENILDLDLIENLFGASEEIREPQASCMCTWGDEPPEEDPPT